MNQIQLYEQNNNAILVREELDVAITTAKAYPRNIEMVLNEVQTQISIDPNIAKGMWYTFPRGNNIIEGPSMRLAEVFLSCWGNLRVQGRIKEISDTYVIAEAVVFDMERNTAVCKEARRKIINKDGVRFNEDMIQLTAQGAISIAIRNALFTIIPRIFVMRALQYAKEIAFKHPKERTKSVQELFNDAVREFSKFKISKEQLLEHLQRSEDNISNDDIIYLRGIYNAIKDGELKPNDIINSKREESNNETDL
ncbi:MAG: hypothetical protein QXS54_03900 [Candidatus Methanomethylicaceae archaeon]